MRTIKCLFGALLVTMSGCHMTKGYQGERPENPAKVYTQGVILRTVNGRPVSGLSTGVEIAPGENEFRLSIDPSNYQNLARDGETLRLNLPAVAGAAYIITANKNGGRPCAWEMNAVTRQPDFSKPAACAER